MKDNIYSQLDIGGKTSSLSTNDGLTRRLSLRIAKITGLDINKNIMAIEWLWPMRGAANNIDIGSPYLGLRSGIRFTPEIGSIIVMGYAGEKVVSLSYLMPSDYDSLLRGDKDAQGERIRIRKLNPGEINIYSSDNAEIYLHDKIELRDKKFDSIVIDPNTKAIYLESVDLSVTNEAGSIKMGQITRGVDETATVITDDGQDFTSLAGGNALNELKIKIKELSDQTILSTAQESPTIAEVTLGTLVDDDGLKVINQAGNEIVCEINFLSGAKIQVDKKGLISFNDPNMLKPTEVPPIADDLSINDTDHTFTQTPQQRAAREGDRITIPFTFATKPDLDHPGLTQKLVFNTAALSKLAQCFMSPYGPCTFIPLQPDVNLIGEVTQGANGVFIGGLDKAKEQQDYNQNS